MRLHVMSTAEVIRAEERVCTEAADRSGLLEEAVTAERSEWAKEIVKLTFVFVQVAEKIWMERVGEN